MFKKRCTKCDKHLALSDFAWKNKSKNKKASECKKCHKLMRSIYYKNNKQTERARITERKKEIRRWYVEYKTSLSCSRCPENHPATIQFHHLDSSQKDLEIATAVNNGWSKTRILNEIKKCEVLCGNCHAKLHWNLRP